MNRMGIKKVGLTGMVIIQADKGTRTRRILVQRMAWVNFFKIF